MEPRPISLLALLLVVFVGMSGCTTTSITASVVSYDVSPGGERLAVVILEGHPKWGESTVWYFDTEEWRIVQLPFDAYKAKVKFVEETVLEVLAREEPGPQMKSALFRVDLVNWTTVQENAWPGEVLDYARTDTGMILAYSEPGTIRLDLADEDGTFLTDYDFRFLYGLEWLDGHVYFSQSGSQRFEEAHAREFEMYEPGILRFDPAIQEIEFFLTRSDASEAGASQVQDLCLVDGLLFTVDRSGGGGRAPMVFSFNLTTEKFLNIAELPYQGDAMACVVGREVYFLHATGNPEQPEHLYIRFVGGGSVHVVAPLQGTHY